MTQNEMKTFQPILNEKGAEITKALRNRQDIISEKAADELDEIATALGREIAVQKLDRESRLLRQILGGLFRIGNGTVGTCLHCDEEISRKRLAAAVPWTSFCLACREAVDRGDQRVLEIAEHLPRRRDGHSSIGFCYTSIRQNLRAVLVYAAYEVLAAKDNKRRHPRILH